MNNDTLRKVSIHVIGALGALLSLLCLLYAYWMNIILAAEGFASPSGTFGPFLNFFLTWGVAVSLAGTPFFVFGVLAYRRGKLVRSCLLLWGPVVVALVPFVAPVVALRLGST